MRLQRVFANWRIFGVLVNDATAWGGEGYMYAQGLEDGARLLAQLEYLFRVVERGILRCLGQSRRTSRNFESVALKSL